MRLSRVSIRNHSRLADVDLHIRDHMVLVGANDVGKSSFLRCLDMALGASTAALYARLTSADFRDHSEFLAIEVALVDFAESEKAAFVDDIDTTAEAGPTVVIRLEAELVDGETVSIQRFAVGGRNRRMLTRLQLSTIGWNLVGAMQSGARDFREEKNSSLQGMLETLDLGSEKESFETAVGKLQEQLNDSGVLKGLRGDLAKQLSQAVPRRIEESDLAFLAGGVADEDLLADVRLRIKKAGELRSMNEQSDGARALFAIAMYDLISSRANIVAIDEPEVHLHPTAQRTLASLLKNSTTQKIIATHSSDIVGAFSPEDVVVVRDKGLAVQANTGFLSGFSKLSAHWWVRDKLEPLTSRQVVLVEGISDRIVMQRAAELLDRDPDRYGVSIVETDGGNEIPNARKIFGPEGFDVDLLMLIDEDAKDKVADKLSVPADELEENSVIISVPDLEGEYTAAIGAGALWQRLVASGEFSPNQLSNCSASGDSNERTDADVAAFCRRSKNKVQASLVVASTMTESEAQKCSSLKKLIDRFPEYD